MPPTPTNYSNVHNRLYQQALAKQRAQKTPHLTAEPSIQNMRSRSLTREEMSLSKYDKVQHYDISQLNDDGVIKRKRISRS